MFFLKTFFDLLIFTYFNLIFLIFGYDIKHNIHTFDHILVNYQVGTILGKKFGF